MKAYRLFWSPTARDLGVFKARTARAAVRKAPLPYRRFLGEIYAVEVAHTHSTTQAPAQTCAACGAQS
jgi:hypothetical protein